MELPRRSYREAWKDYARGHIVSEHSKRIILHFLVANCCYSSKEQKDEDGEKDSEPLEKLPAMSMTLHTLHQHMQSMTDATRLLTSSSQQSQARQDVQSGCKLADNLWTQCLYGNL